jgi:hypothetical protein
MTKRLAVGVVGCGTVSEPYLQNMSASPLLKVVACADQVQERAQARAAEFHVPKACTVEELLADPEVDLVVNLTVPSAHVEINLAALAAGKHVYSEKPLATTRDDGSRILEAACMSSARPTQFSAPECRPVFGCWRTEKSASPSPHLASSSIEGPRTGIRTLPSFINRAGVRFSTWALITSRRWSVFSVLSARLPA